MRVTLRAVRKDDEEFLLRLYASTRADEVAGFGWSPEQQDAFLRMQFTAQKRSYEAAYLEAEHNIIVVECQSVGRMMVSRSRCEVHLVDIALFPEFRHQGIGSTLMKGLQDEARSTDRALVLHVEKRNAAARRFYERLGFVLTSEDQMYCAMKWFQAADQKEDARGTTNVKRA